MTKADIVEHIYEKTGFHKRDAIEMVETIFDIIKSTLENGETIKVARFGNFTVKQKKDRIGRNPQTGEVMTISSRKVLTFKPSQILKQSLNTSR